MKLEECLGGGFEGRRKRRLDILYGYFYGLKTDGIFSREEVNAHAQRSLGACSSRRLQIYRSK